MTSPAAYAGPRQFHLKDPESLIPGCSGCLTSASSREQCSLRLLVLLVLTTLLAGCSGVALSYQFGACSGPRTIHRAVNKVGVPDPLVEPTPTSAPLDKYGPGLYPMLENASGAIAGWLNLVPLGQCRAYADSFAEHGSYLFRHSGNQLSLTTREDVYQLCLAIKDKIKATRLIWNFIDEDDKTIVALVEEFVEGKPGEPLRRHRAGVMFKTKIDKATGYRTVVEYGIVTEEKYENQKEHVKSIVEASLERRRSFSCSRWRDILNKEVDVRVQGNHSLDKHGAAEALVHCQEFANSERQASLIHHAEVDGIFSSDHMVMVFFKIESLRKGMLIFEEHPEALLLWMAHDNRTGAVPQVRVLHDFKFESLTIVAAWYRRLGVRDVQNLEAAGAAVVTAAGNGKPFSVMEL